MAKENGIVRDAFTHYMQQDRSPDTFLTIPERIFSNYIQYSNNTRIVYANPSFNYG